MSQSSTNTAMFMMSIINCKFQNYLSHFLQNYLSHLTTPKLREHLRLYCVANVSLPVVRYWLS
ncbi:hypothetical protein BWR59_31695 [Pseudomonas sp. Bc-h]|nr:hypothetical protein BWR59_31695 [Pseudomonas sp. Bc-h]